MVMPDMYKDRDDQRHLEMSRDRLRPTEMVTNH